MEKNLVIVESPAKAKTIEKFLGKDFHVMSSYGHIRDLKKKDFSIDVENNFEPIYEVPDDKKIGRAHAELQSRPHLVCRLLLEKKNELYLHVPTLRKPPPKHGSNRSRDNLLKDVQRVRCHALVVHRLRLFFCSASVPHCSALPT